MKTFIYSFIFLTSLVCFSQNEMKLKVIESQEYRDKYYMFGDVLANYMSPSGITGVVRKRNRDMLFEAFDNNLNPIFKDLIKGELKEELVGYVSFDDEIKIFTVFSPKQKKRIVSYYVFNLENLSIKKTQLFEVTLEKGSNSLFSNRKHQTNFAISPNGKFIALSTDNIKKNLNSYTIRVFDSNTLEEMNQKSYNNHQDQYFELNDLFIDDKGNAFTLGKLFIDGKSQKKKNQANYKFIVNKITPNEVEKLEINLDSLHIKSLSFNNKGSQLELLGFYSEKKVSNVKGTCVFVLNLDTFELKNKHILYQLPQQVYQDLYGTQKAKKKKDKELSNFKVDYVINDSEGNSYWLAEQFYITYSYVNNGFGGYRTITYHYDDILVLKFDSNGKLNWGRSIFKNAPVTSYNAFLKDNNLHVILNSGKNLTIKSDGRTKVSKGWLESTALYDFVYSEDGDVSYNKIQDNKGNSFYRPYLGTFFNNRFIMMSAISLKRRFMVLE